MRRIQFVIGQIYHIYNRGVEEREIFLSDADRWRFLQGLFLFNDEDTATNLLFRLERDKGSLNFRILRGYLNQQKNQRRPLVRIISDCLKPNHFHLTLEELQMGGISRFMHKVGVGYTKYFNQKYQRTGHLFEGPFRAVRVENDDQFKYLLVYINVINPAQEIEPRLKEKGLFNVERIMKFVEDYPWSTHLEYLGKRSSLIIDKGIAGKIFSHHKEYEEFAREIMLGKRSLKTIQHLLLE